MEEEWKIVNLRVMQKFEHIRLSVTMDQIFPALHPLK